MNRIYVSIAGRSLARAVLYTKLYAKLLHSALLLSAACVCAVHGRRRGRGGTPAPASVEIGERVVPLGLCL